jgi:hypothetical protein
MQSIGYKAVNRRKAIRGFVPEHRHQMHTAEGRTAWEKKHYKELEPYLLKWQAAVAILCKSEVFTQGLYDFFAGRKFYQGFNQAKLSDILGYLESRYGAYVRKDITTSERNILSSIGKDIYNGISIQDVRIFPEVYYPYMDRLYYDHINWNRVPMGVGFIMEHEKDLNKFVFGTELDIDIISSDGISGCHCNSCITALPTSSLLKVVKVSDTTLNQLLDYPILLIGYKFEGNTTFYRHNSDCYCTIKNTTHRQGCQLGVVVGGTICGKPKGKGSNPCSHGDHICERESNPGSPPL